MTNENFPVENFSALAVAEDEPIPYRARVREYYLALGYETPYRWAHFKDVPFAPLKKPLSQSTVAIVTTAAPFNKNAGEQGPGASYNGAAKFFSVYEMDSSVDADLRISHIAYDRQHTTATDSRTWFPLVHLQAFANQGIVGKVAPNFYGLPTVRSHRITIEQDCPELVRRIAAASVDVCILVPNCPVCHQSVSIAARQLEAAGIATVVMGCARDIVEYVGVPRFVFSDFPLGNGAGKPHDEQSQKSTLKLALDTLSGAPAAKTTVQSAQRWDEDISWKRDYCNVEMLSTKQRQSLRVAFDQQKAAASRVSGD